MSARGSPTRSTVAMLVATVIAGLLAGACGSGRDGGQGVAPSRPAATQTIGPLTALTLADQRVPALASLLAPAITVVVQRRISFADGDGAVTALQRGRRADVLVTCSDEYPADLARAGLLQPLDTQRLPGLLRVVPAMRSLPGTTVDGRVYAVPLEAGVVGIVYDHTAVKRPPASFRALFSRSATGQVAMIDSPALGLQIGALALGYRAPAALNEVQLLQVTVLYENRRGNFGVFWRRRPGLLRAFRSGKVTLAAATESDATWLRAHGVPVRFIRGAEGGLLWACLAGIPANAPHPDAAYAFLAAALSPAAQGALSTTAAAHDAVVALQPEDSAAWLIAWTKAKEPLRPGGG